RSPGSPSPAFANASARSTRRGRELPRPSRDVVGLIRPERHTIAVGTLDQLRTRAGLPAGHLEEIFLALPAPPHRGVGSRPAPRCGGAAHPESVPAETQRGRSGSLSRAFGHFGSRT